MLKFSFLYVYFLSCMMKNRNRKNRFLVTELCPVSVRSGKWRKYWRKVQISTEVSKIQALYYWKSNPCWQPVLKRKWLKNICCYLLARAFVTLLIRKGTVFTSFFMCQLFFQFYLNLCRTSEDRDDLKRITLEPSEDATLVSIFILCFLIWAEI